MTFFCAEIRKACAKVCVDFWLSEPFDVTRAAASADPRCWESDYQIALSALGGPFAAVSDHPSVCMRCTLFIVSKLILNEVHPGTMPGALHCVQGLRLFG